MVDFKCFAEICKKNFKKLTNKFNIKINYIFYPFFYYHKFLLFFCFLSFFLSFILILAVSRFHPQNWNFCYLHFLLSLLSFFVILFSLMSFYFLSFFLSLKKKSPFVNSLKLFISKLSTPRREIVTFFSERIFFTTSLSTQTWLSGNALGWWTHYLVNLLKIIVDTKC